VAHKTISDLRQYLAVLQKEREILTVTEAVDPHLEIAEIHRRVIAKGGPALLFTNVKGSRFPVVTNLFGTSPSHGGPSGSSPIWYGPWKPSCRRPLESSGRFGHSSDR